MNAQDATQITRSQLLAAPAAERAGLIEAYLLESVRALRKDASGNIDAATQLSDLSIDSIQIVDLKFGIDQLLGQELDIELFITNPSIHELAVNSVRAVGLDA
jgi:acyl carrier protein